MENLERLVTDEQLLDFALSVLIRDDGNEVAEKILYCYTVNHFENLGVEPTEEQMEKKLGDLFVEYVKELMVKEGMAEVCFDADGDPSYSFSEEGQAVMLAILHARFEG